MNIRIVKNLVEMASGYHDAILRSGNFLHLNHEQSVEIVVDSKYTSGETTLIYSDIYGVANTITSGAAGVFTFSLTDVTLNNIAVVHATVTVEDLQLIEDDPEVLINTVLTGTNQGLSFEPSKIITMHPCNEGLAGGFALSELVTGTSAIIQGYTAECRLSTVLNQEDVDESIVDRPYGIQSLLFDTDEYGVIKGFSTIDELDFENSTGYIDSRWLPTTDSYTIIEDGNSGARAYVIEDEARYYYYNGELDTIEPDPGMTETLKIRNTPIDGSDFNDKTKTKVRIYNRALNATEIRDEYYDSIGISVSTFLKVYTDVEFPPNIITSMDGAVIHIDKNLDELSYSVWSLDQLPDISVRNPNEGYVLAVDVLTLPDSITSMKSMFECCDAAVTIDLSPISTPNVTDMSNMFKGCLSLEQVKFSEKFTTFKVTNMRAMFLECKSLDVVPFNSFNTVNVTDMSHMFRNSKVSSLFMSYFNTSNVREMSYMFAGSDMYTTHFTMFNLESVIYMVGMYEGCTDISIVDTGDILPISSIALRSISKIFKNCSNITEVHLDNLYTANVEDFSRMFNGCVSLSLLKLLNMVTTSATDMSYMFYNCSKLLDFNTTVNFTTASVTNLTSMFHGCRSLVSIYNPGFESPTGVTHFNMFNGASTLKCVNRIETVGSIGTTGMFTGCAALTAPDPTKQSELLAGSTWLNTETCTSNVSGFSMLVRSTGKPMFHAEGGTLDIIPFESNDEVAVEMVGQLAVEDEEYWFIYSGDPITHVYVDRANTAQDIITAYILSGNELTSIANMFYNCINLTHVSLEGITSTGITDASSAFHNCNSLLEFITPVNRDLFDNTLDMSRMLYGCHNLQVNPDFGPTSVVTDMSFMYSECRAITVIDMGELSAPSVTNTSSMFEGCVSLMYISFNTGIRPVLLKADSMFAKCSALINLPIGSIDFSQVSNFDHFVYGCDSLLCMGDLDVTSMTSNHHMFTGSDALTAPDVAEQTAILAGTSWDNPLTCETGDALYNVIVYSASRPAPVAYDEEMNVVEGVFAVLPAPGLLGAWRIFSDVPSIYYHSLSISLTSPNVITYVDVINLDNVVSTRFMLLNAHALRSVVFDVGCESSLLTNTACMFADKNLTSPVSFANLDTSRVTDMSKMFSYPSVTPTYSNAYSSDLDTSAVTDMSYMFYGSDKEFIDLTDFTLLDTSNVTTMYQMFAYTTNYGNITFENLNIGATVLNVSQMFAYSDIYSVDMSDATSTSLVDASKMFFNCKKLTQVNLDASMLNGGSLLTTASMFEGCSKMEFVHLPEFTGVSVQNISKMFKGCKTLNRIDVFDGYPVNTTNASALFEGCESMVTIDFTPVNNVLNGMGGMFRGCTSLTCINSVDTLLAIGDRAADTIGMFDVTPALIAPDAATIDTLIQTGLEWVNPTPCV